MTKEERMLFPFTNGLKSIVMQSSWNLHHEFRGRIKQPETYAQIVQLWTWPMNSVNTYLCIIEEVLKG